MAPTSLETTSDNRPVRSCASLVTAVFSDGSRVTSAAEIPATEFLPQYCSVTLVIPDRITVVASLPTSTWNGRYKASGNGGYGGAPLGVTETSGLVEGYVISATDMGHQKLPPRASGHGLRPG